MNAKVSTITDLLTYTFEDYDVVTLWNKVCEQYHYPDDMIYSMDEFDEICGPIAHNDGLISLIDKVQYGGLNTNDSWFWFNGYANLCSGDNPVTADDSPIDIDQIIGYLEEYGDEYGLFDTSDLVQGFIDEFFNLNDDAERILNELIDDEEVDLIKDDWYEVKDTVEERLNDEEDEDGSEDEDE